MKSPIAIILAVVSFGLSAGNLVYSINKSQNTDALLQLNPELERLALAFFKEEEAKRLHNKRVQQDNAKAEELEFRIP